MPPTANVLPDLAALLWEVAPEAFERQIAALTDILLASKRRVVWVTPPPYPTELDRIRLFAAAITRVAESRQVPVADLFTGFLCTEDKSHPLFCTERLVPTGRGHMLAGKIIAGALLGETGEDQPWRSSRWSLVSGSLR